MKLILSKKESQSLDKLSNSKKYISSDKLMNNAGKLSAQYFIENIQNPFNKIILEFPIIFHSFLLFIIFLKHDILTFALNYMIKHPHL